MDPAQLIRSLGTACRLLGLQREHAEAVAAGDDAELEVAVGLVDALLEAVERRLDERPTPRPAARADVATTTRVARVLDRIRELAAAGRSDPEIAAELDRSVWAVAKLRQRYDIPPGVPPGGASLGTGWREKIGPLHDAGLTIAQIAAQTGYTVRTVEQRLYELRKEEEGCR